MTSPQIQSRILHIGHTPDPDDAYMFYGFATNQVKIRDFTVKNVLEDIQRLNHRALHGEIEVTAISAALYPHIQKNYWIMPIGASVGRNYGPIITKIKNENPPGKKIGIPGQHTTAYLLLQLYAQGYDPVVYQFDEIPRAMKRGDVDYGLLIHEAQLTFDALGLEKIMDLGAEWMKDTGLPIPLGLDVIRKDVGKELALDICRAFKASIETANQHREKAVEYAKQFGRGLASSLTDQFVGMYVNEDTLELGDEGEKALNLLFDKAYRNGLLASPSIVEIIRPS